MFVPAQYNSTSNSLLAKIVRFLNLKETRLQDIQNLVNESTTAQLVPSFAFLGVWLVSNANSESMALKNVQVAYHIIHLIATKVPPVILVCGLSDLNWTEHQFRVTHSMVFLSFFDRIQTIRSYMKPIALETDLSRFSHCHIQIDSSFANKYPGLLTEVGGDPQFQIGCIQHFQRLIMNNVPIGDFKPLLQHKNSTIMLSYAIIGLLTKFNKSRTLTHHQLLFYFTIIFRYITSFALSDNINGLMITQHILNLPSVSPFLLIAMVSNIPKALYIYNLLIPKKLTKGDLTDEEAKKAIIEQFSIIDMSLDNSLNKLIEFVPQFLYAFFLEYPVLVYEMPHSPDFIDHIITLHLSSKPLPETMKNIFSRLDQEMSPTEIICMGLQLTKFILSNVQRGFIRFSREKQATFWKFFAALSATALPTISDQFSTRFCEAALKDPTNNMAEFLINGILNYGLHIIMNLPYENHFISFLFSCLKQNEELQMVSRLILLKLIQSDVLHISTQIVDIIKSCEDLVLILEYIDALQNLKEITQFNDLKAIDSLIADLINKIPYNISRTPVLLINSVVPIQPHFNNISTMIYQKVSAYLQSSKIDLSRHLSTIPPNYLHLLIKVLSTTFFVQKYETAKVLTERSIFMLNDQSNILNNLSNFQVSSSMLILPIAQHLLRQLLVFKHNDLAIALLDAITKPLLKDLIPSRWICRFLVKNYEILTPEIKQAFDKIVRLLPDANELYLSPYQNHTIQEIIHNIQIHRKINLHDPNVIYKEQISPFRHALTFSTISILLRNEPVHQIVFDFVEPLYEPFQLKCNQNVLYSISRLLEYMPATIAIGVFNTIIQKEVYVLPLNILRVFMALTTIDVFKKICESGCDLIKQNDNRLTAFLYAIMPNFSRLKNDEDVATKFLCGLLENVNAKTPRSLQENVIDAVGMVYVMLRLNKKRAALINSAKHFTPELKAIIASSLDIDIDFPRSPTPPVRAYGGNINTRMPSFI
ncbi:hypothetical protein TRFO_13763 [Tritrichomonas foetus]|uniref:Uncharacterized protein n=1 Tax=Tritrichomonas foetus TaxID=1144522 RepID=A0A1J4KY10_9EUKA|nr:hypothetical protein TRFO_13763 [Tritrichomonas foetus]|eukprot:OHT15776.1 hypothetical protein TRFO_13763 [Tritrichomonas foetus]